MDTCTCTCYIILYVLGGDCVIVKSGRRICGTGAALANAPLVQDKSYFEIKIQCGGMTVSYGACYMYNIVLDIYHILKFSLNSPHA